MTLPSKAGVVQRGAVAAIGLTLLHRANLHCDTTQQRERVLDVKPYSFDDAAQQRIPADAAARPQDRWHFRN
jgi:hypothetical protein